MLEATMLLSIHDVLQKSLPTGIPRLLEKVKPLIGELVPDLGGPSAVFNFFAPVKTEPATGYGPRCFHKTSKLLDGAIQGKGFFDDYRLSYVKAFQDRQVCIEIRTAWIEMDADKVQVARDYPWIKPRIKSWLV